MSDLDARFAQAREAKREKDYVSKRLAETRADRTRVMQQLEVTKELLANEQADVDRLEKGVGGFFRRMTASRDDLTREQKELEAAKAQHQALLDELEAVDADLAQLCQREAAVVDADRQYAAVLDEKAAAARAGGSPAAAQLTALGDTEARIAGMRKEVGEAIAAGQAAFAILSRLQQAATSNNTAAYGIGIGASFGSSITSSLFGDAAGVASYIGADVATAAVRETLRGELGQAQHALTRFQRECRDVAPTGLDGIVLTPLPNLGTLIAREIVWTNSTVVDDIHSEISLIANHVAQTVMELRGRDEQLAKASAEVSAQRAAVLDPARERL